MIVHGFLRKSPDDARELKAMFERMYGRPR
jgi:hypothetical protein